eukprot:GHVR01110498.1.p2 GENE.GHVR01110498.1~~GHVR01110498.1.p2  ORF type:complete len:296 (+),score=94.44 GHVR01110498.1:3-890(+)
MVPQEPVAYNLPPSKSRKPAKRKLSPSKLSSKARVAEEEGRRTKFPSKTDTHTHTLTTGQPQGKHYKRVQDKQSFKTRGGSKIKSLCVANDDTKPHHYNPDPAQKLYNAVTRLTHLLEKVLLRQQSGSLPGGQKDGKSSREADGAPSLTVPCVSLSTIQSSYVAITEVVAWLGEGFPEVCGMCARLPYEERQWKGGGDWVACDDCGRWVHSQCACVDTSSTCVTSSACYVNSKDAVDTHTAITSCDLKNYNGWTTHEDAQRATVVAAAAAAAAVAVAADGDQARHVRSYAEESFP